ncbi:MAG: tetratricopeptide repeat protein, partial [Phycisphaerae bacterium]|nr:tetratricopeptide repeat protein [Phycisphaerae bacterium]
MRRFSAAASQANLALKHRPDLVEAYAIAAVAHEAQSDFVEAVKAREKLLELRPNLTTNSFRLGRLYERISKFEEAEKALKQALESKPDAAAIVAELASFYARHGQRSKGQALMSAFVNSHSEDPLAHRLQGTFYFRSLNALQPAIGAYDKAIALSKPKEMAAQPMMDKAEVFIGLKRYKDAVKIHRQALVLVPGDVKMMGRMAETQMLARDIDGAMATLKAIDKERPNNPPTMVLKAQVYTLQNKLEDAEKLLRRALAARPNYGQARLQWARIRLHEKDFLGAMAELQKISPNDVAFSPGMRQLARIQETLGQRVEAIRTLQRLLEVDPMSNLAQMSLARLHIANDQPDRAEKILKNLEKIRPNDAYIAMQLALAQERQGKFGAARANYQKAWALSRAQTVGALEGQVRMMVKMGQGEQAKALLRNMIAKDPRPVAPWILLAGAHTRAKQWAEAQKLLDNAISTHPASEKLYLEKATFFRAQGKDTEASAFLR